MSNLLCQLVVAYLVLSGETEFANSLTVTPSSIRSSQIITIAGSVESPNTETGGVATAMTLNGPEGVWMSSTGSVYFVENGSSCVRKFSYSNGIVFAVAGVVDSSGSSGDNGPATSAFLFCPYGIVVDSVGVVYIADTCNGKVRMVSESGIISTIAGTGTFSNSGDAGPASSASVYGPVGIWMDSLSQLYVTTYYGNTVRRIGSDENRIITTIAGASTSASFSGDGGPATSAAMNSPYAVFVDTVGVVYFSDSNNYRVRRVTTGGIISTVIGTGSTTFNGDQPGTSCNLNLPKGVVVDPSNGDIYTAADGNNMVQLLSTNSGIVTVFAGNQNFEYSAESVAATCAGVVPNFLFLDPSNRLLISDHYNQRIRMTYPTTSLSPRPSISPSEGVTTGFLTGTIEFTIVWILLIACAIWWWLRRAMSYNRDQVRSEESDVMLLSEMQTINTVDQFV